MERVCEVTRFQTLRADDLGYGDFELRAIGLTISVEVGIVATAVVGEHIQGEGLVGLHESKVWGSVEVGGIQPCSLGLCSDARAAEAKENEQ